MLSEDEREDDREIDVESEDEDQYGSRHLSSKDRIFGVGKRHVMLMSHKKDATKPLTQFIFLLFFFLKVTAY